MERKVTLCSDPCVLHTSRWRSLHLLTYAENTLIRKLGRIDSCGLCLDKSIHLCDKPTKMSQIQALTVSVNEQISAAAAEIFVVIEKRIEVSEIHVLRMWVNERLAAVAEEILRIFEKTIAEYEDKVSRSEQENCRQRKLLDVVLKPEIKLHRAGL